MRHDPTAAEVERRVTSPLERLMCEIEGVEYVYTTSQPGRATAIVRFRVGEDVEHSLVKVHQKLVGNADKIPPEVLTCGGAVSDDRRESADVAALRAQR